MAASVCKISQPSRFAVLSINDSDDSDENTKKTKKQQSNQNGTKSNSAKKRNRKKKKAEEEQAETQQLRDLAFGGGGGGKPKPKKNPPTQNPKKTGPGGDSDEQWNEWKKADEDFTNDQYQTDLQKAILQSKLDFEKVVEMKAVGGSDGNEENAKEGKKKKKKKAMSLGEFKKLDENAEPSEPAAPQPKGPTTKVDNPDTAFFERVEEDASKTVMKEKIQEEYTKQYIVQNARTAHFEKEISKKDKEIIMLRATVAKLKEENLEAKKRNQQLCNILAQGEMKDKAGVLQSLDELTQVKNELLDQINVLTADLEKEKSRSHGLKTELERYQAKASKHK